MAKRYIPVEGWTGFVRDPSTGTIINTDHTQIEKARENKKRLREEKEARENRFVALENEVSEMKELLLKIYQRVEDAH